MQYNAKIALASLFAAVVIVGAGTAVYLKSDALKPSLADGPATSTSLIAAVDSSDLIILSGLFSKDQQITRTLAVNKDLYLVMTERMPKEGDGLIFELWRADLSTKEITEINDYTTMMLSGLKISMTTELYSNEHRIAFDDAWEGWIDHQSVYVDNDGRLIAKISNPDQISFAVTGPKNEKIDVKQVSDFCPGTITTNTINNLLVNGKVFALKNPHKVSCSMNDIAGVNGATLFTDFTVNHLDADGERTIVAPFYEGNQSIVITIKKDGSMTVGQ